MTVDRRDLDFPIGLSVARVSAILTVPEESRLLFVLAHGAGAGMRHAFLEDISGRLADRHVATFRFQFPYMQAGTGRPDATPVAEATIVAAVQTAGTALPHLPIIAGGKSFGGRMTSHAAVHHFLPGVRGLAFLGFPLHPPKKPSITRADHLDRVPMPMLFLQGTRDTLADLGLIRSVTDRLGDQATLHVVEGGDHSFKVLKRSGRTDTQVMDDIADVIADWSQALVGLKGRGNASLDSEDGTVNLQLR